MDGGMGGRTDESMEVLVVGLMDACMVIWMHG